MMKTRLPLKLIKIKSISSFIIGFTIGSWLMVLNLSNSLNQSQKTKTCLQPQKFMHNNQFLYTNDSNYEFLIDLTKRSQYNIFFLETNYNRSEFSTKELCAIESAAKTNPKAKIFIFLINAEFSKYKINFTESYPNLIWVKFDPLELFRDTPLFTWWQNREWSLSSYITVHLSDAARIALLYKYGGFYSDLDTIAVKSFEPLRYKSGAGYLNETWNSLGNGFLHFTKNHPFLEFLMKEFKTRYNSKKRGKNGPKLLIESIARYCELKNIFQPLMNKTSLPINHKCNDLVIYPEMFFYPYSYISKGKKKLFGKNASVEISFIIGAYSIHFYGGLTHNIKVKINDFNLYEYLAAHHCPFTYEYVKMNKINFF
jgi:hypothetical protein